MAKPSWCLLVTTTYFIPHSFANFTHSSALKNTGLNAFASFSYSEIGICRLACIHSAYWPHRLPFHSPASREYSPQCTIIPYCASLNHFLMSITSVSLQYSAYLIPFMDNAILFFATSTLMTRTSTTSPTLTASSGCLINRSLI